MDTQWQAILAKLQTKLEPGTFRVWISPLEAKIADGKLCLLAPNAYMAGWVEKRLSSAIHECIHDVLDGDLIVEVGVKKQSPKEKTAKKSASSPAKKQPSETVTVSAPYLPTSYAQPLPKRSWRYCFTDFVEGESNRMAVAAAKEVCRVHGDVQTLYVNASSGLGKTHLVQAVGQDISLNCIDQRINYMTAEEFSSRYVASLKTNEVENFKDSLRGLDVLLLEDIHFLQNKPKIQETALSVVKTLQDKGGRVIFTSSFTPQEMQKVDRQFFSSFCSNGIVTRIGKPDEAMRSEIISRKAKSANVKISDSVANLIAASLDGDIRQLESCLQSIVFKANLLHTDITKDLVSEVLQEYTSLVKSPDLDLLTSLVCENYGLDATALQTKSRCQRNVNGRNTIFYLARKYTDLTLKEIGQPFNRRHSTVLQGITSVEKEIASNSTLGRQIARIVALVEENVTAKRKSK